MFLLGVALCVTSSSITINRAPVLTLGAAVVAQRLGFRWEESLSLGRALAGLNAQSKGRRLGIFKPSEVRKAEHCEPMEDGGDVVHTGF